MDRKFYFQTVDKLQNMKLNPDYIQGWIGGYMQNPKREEQRTTDAYESGYEDGGNHDTDHCDDWLVD